MRLIIRDDSETASVYVANYIIERINHFCPTPAHPFVLGLPTGSSPLNVYRVLVERYKAGDVSFENVVTFNMDEYIGIPRDHPESYHSFMWKHFFAHVNVQPENVHILDGNAANLEAECVAYEEEIRRRGGIDLFLGGIGEDGHVAFNEPGSSLSSRTRVKTLAYDTILANSRFFGGDLDAVPRMALTVGVQTVLEAREVVVVILGARKAAALQRCVEGGVNHMWTLSSLQLHPHPMIVCDEDATLELQVKTVKYFKSIEKVAKEQGFEQILPSAVRTGHTSAAAAARDQQNYYNNTKNNNNSSSSSRAAQQQQKIPKTVVVDESVHSPPQSPTLLAAPKPETTSSRLLRPSSPAAEYPVRSVSPDLVPDRMADRVVGAGGGDPSLARRLTPNPEQQQQRKHLASVGA